MKLTLSLLALLAGAGCASNIKSIGIIGDRAYYKVHARSFDGPNITQIVSVERGDPTEVHTTATAHGPSIGHSILGIGSGAAHGVAAAATFGANLRPARVQNDANVDVQTWAQGGEVMNNPMH